MFKDITEKWFLTEPLLFQIVCAHNMIEDDTIGIPIKCGKGNIIYNPDLIGKMDEIHKEKYLKLECIRILLKHPYSRQPLGASLETLIGASDITVSEYCKTDIPKNTLSIKSFSPNFPPKLTFEDYYYLLVPEIKKFILSKSNIDNGKAIKDLSQMLGLSEAEVKEMIDKLIEGASEWEENEEFEEKIGKIVQQAEDSNSWGSLGGDLKNEIIAAQVPKLNIRKHIEHFKTSIISIGNTLTRMKPNRRYGFKQMGSKHPYTTRLLIGLDVSGSVSNDSLSKFLGTINTFFKQGIEQVDVIEFDAEITSEKPLNMRKAMKHINITGRGGTIFQPVIDYAYNNKYDGLVVFTDGYASTPTIPKGFNVLWVLDSRKSYDDFKMFDNKIYIKA